MVAPVASLVDENIQASKEALLEAMASTSPGAGTIAVLIASPEQDKKLSVQEFLQRVLRQSFREFLQVAFTASICVMLRTPRVSARRQGGKMRC